MTIIGNPFKYVQDIKTIMGLLSISSLLSAISVFLLVVGYLRLKFKIMVKDRLNPPKFPTTL